MVQLIFYPIKFHVEIIYFNILCMYVCMYLFTYLFGDKQREREADHLSTEPNAGLDPTILISRPEPKPRARHSTESPGHLLCKDTLRKKAVLTYSTILAALT